MAAVASMAAFMEVLDTSIANVSLPHVAGSLAVSLDESTWVLTTYLVANVIILPISGWISNTIGRKRFFMAAIALFTASSVSAAWRAACRRWSSSASCRAWAAGGLAPVALAILVDTFPTEKRGTGHVALRHYGARRADPRPGARAAGSPTTSPGTGSS